MSTSETIKPLEESPPELPPPTGIPQDGHPQHSMVQGSIPEQIPPQKEGVIIEELPNQPENSMKEEVQVQNPSPTEPCQEEKSIQTEKVIEGDQTKQETSNPPVNEEVPNKTETLMKEQAHIQLDKPTELSEEEKSVQNIKVNQEDHLKQETTNQTEHSMKEEAHVQNDSSKETTEQEKSVQTEKTTQDHDLKQELPNQPENSLKEESHTQNDKPIETTKEQKSAQNEKVTHEGHPPLEEKPNQTENSMKEEPSTQNNNPIELSEANSIEKDNQVKPEPSMTEEKTSQPETSMKEELPTQTEKPIETTEEQKSSPQETTIQEEQPKPEPSMTEETSKKPEEPKEDPNILLFQQAIEELKQGNLDTAFCVFSSKDDKMSEEIVPWDLLTHSIALIPYKPLQAHCYLRFLDEFFLPTYEESDLNTIKTHLYFHLARTWLSNEAQALADMQERFTNVENCLKNSLDLSPRFIEAMYLQFKILEHSIEYKSDPDHHQKRFDFLKKLILTLSETPGLDSTCVELVLKKGLDYINQSRFPTFAKRTVSMLFFEYGKQMCQYEMKDHYDQVKLGVSLYACSMGIDQNIYALLALGTQTLYRGVPHIDENPHFEAHSVSSMVDLIKRDQDQERQTMYMEIMSKYKKLIRSGQIFNTVIVWAFALPDYEYLNPTTTLAQIKALMYLGIVKGKLGKMEMDMGNRLRIYKEAKTNIEAAIRGISDENTMKNIPFWEKAIIQPIEFREAFYELGKLYEKSKLHILDGHVSDTINCWRCMKSAQVNYKKCQEFIKPAGQAVQHARKFSSLYEYKKDPTEKKIYQVKLRSPTNPSLIKCDVYEKRKNREMIHNHFTYDAFTQEVLLSYFAASSFDDLIKRASELKEGVENPEIKRAIDLLGQILDSEKLLRLIQGAECNLPLALYDVSLGLPVEKQAILLKGSCYPLAQLKYMEIGGEAKEDAPPEIMKECTRMARKALKELRSEVAVLECDMKRVEIKVQEVLDERKHEAEQMITEARGELSELVKKEELAGELKDVLGRCEEIKLFVSNTLFNSGNLVTP